MADSSVRRPRLAEVVAVLAKATDLGLGLPMEHAIRTCLLSVALGRRVGMTEPELSDLYYLSLLRMLGCTTDSAEYADLFGDEVEFGRDTQHLDYGDPQAFGGWVMESFAAGRPPDVRRAMIEKLFTYTPERRRASLAGHCEVAQLLARRLGCTDPVVSGLAYVFERWDGTGAPAGARGEELPPGVRIMHLCNELEVHHRLGGPPVAETMAQARAGTAFDPDLVRAFRADPDEILAALDRASVWDDLLATEPKPHRWIDETMLVEAGRVMADFADLKSRHFAGHSTGVADLVVLAAPRCRIDASDQLPLRIAALAHDLGRVTVSTSVWDKPGPLNDSEWERVRLHSYYSERLLAQAGSLAPVAALAGMHHERLDGSGYHRGSGRQAQTQAGRLLAAADAYVAMRRTRAYRPALDPDQAGDQLRAMAVADRMDTGAVNAVLAAAGDRGPQVRRRWPAGLTDREVDVLREVAGGRSIQETAAALHVAAKTVDFHLQNIYAKAGITTRAAATLFAVQNDLLRP